MLTDDNEDQKIVGLQALCATRFTARTGAYGAVLKNFNALLVKLQEISDGGRGQVEAKASGLLDHLLSFKMFFAFRLSKEIYSAAETLSCSLQSSSINAQTAMKAVSVFQEFLERMRQDTMFGRLYDSCVTEGVEKLGCNPPEDSVPRNRKAPRRFDAGSEAHQWTNPKDYFRKQYYEVIDLMQNEIKRRFDKNSFQKLILVEKIILTAANGNVGDEIDEDLMSELCKTYDQDISEVSLTSELKLLPAARDTYQKSSKQQFKCISNLTTVCDILMDLGNGAEMFSKITKLLVIYFTAPVTTCTAERSFSMLRRTKSYTRSTMTEKRLNHLMLLEFYSNLTDSINVENLAKMFINSKSVDIRKHYFGMNA